ncbi:uncharacterized protein UV8b_05012 [Ustilaginoidea virens]|uniref:Efficient mitochondria targeting-associated protein 19 n=1 Tax=Ustilaginoidea virens TaxID=1159556 RepID=A0A8E5HSJ9_USTVR|nr:uncharacterized protein UV8b_05012 [Ustilaginoidea virens]QUC20771.1 hypothetical protein UV8b_05012 [Ustilaginoidea virens]
MPTILEKLYLPIVATQLVGMLLLDLVPLYPRFLWQDASSPLHGLLSLRAWWTATSGDPYFASLGHEPWFQAFLYVEAVLQLPLTAFLVYKLASSRPTSGPTELAGLVYGCVTALSSLACCLDIWHMGPERVRADKKEGLLWGAYFPYVVIPAVMAVDMWFFRLLPRMRAAPKASKGVTGPAGFR